LQRDQWGLVEDLRHHDVITDTSMMALALWRIKSIRQSQAGRGTCATLRYAAILRSIHISRLHTCSPLRMERVAKAPFPRVVSMYFTCTAPSLHRTRSGARPMK
jgi:hypothetical protein